MTDDAMEMIQAPHEREDPLLPPPAAYATVEHECVIAGGGQIVRIVEANPGDGMTYRVRFDCMTSLADESLRGSGEGVADDGGEFSVTFTVSGEALAAMAVVGAFVRDADGKYRGSTHTTFDVTEVGGSCPAQ